MMDLKDFVKGKKWKKIGKDQWLIVFLVGILLLVIAVPSDCGASAGSGEKKPVAQEADESDADNYEDVLERRLEQVLSSMDGVGRVEVMITLKDEGESVVEKDVSTNGDTQTDTDGEGNVTEQMKSERSEETVYSSQSSDGEPFVSRQIVPNIEGILIVAEGGADTKVAKNISEAVEALFGLEAHKIKVVKMNLQEGSN